MALPSMMGALAKCEYERDGACASAGRLAEGRSPETSTIRTLTWAVRAAACMAWMAPMAGSMAAMAPASGRGPPYAVLGGPSEVALRDSPFMERSHCITRATWMACARRTSACAPACAAWTACDATVNGGGRGSCRISWRNEAVFGDSGTRGRGDMLRGEESV